MFYAALLVGLVFLIRLLSSWWFHIDERIKNQQKMISLLQEINNKLTPGVTDGNTETTPNSK